MNKSNLPLRILSFLLLGFVFVLPWPTTGSEIPPKPHPKKVLLKTLKLSVKEVRDLKEFASEVEVVGYLISISNCPPCPPQAVCEACLPNHIVIDEKPLNPKLKSQSFTDSQLILRPDHNGTISDMTIGQRYRFFLKAESQLPSSKNRYGSEFERNLRYWQALPEK